MAQPAVLLVRHAAAVARHEWDDEDWSRPLSDRGKAQAAALVAQLAGYGIGEVLSSPSQRCLDTVAPLAGARGLVVKPEEALFEGNSTSARVLVRRLLGRPVALCTHGDVIPEILQAVTIEDGVDIGAMPRCQKGSTWVLEPTPDHRRVAEAIYLPPPGWRPPGS